MSQLKKSPIAKAVAFAAVLLLLAAGQSLATDDKQDKTVKGRIESLEALVKDLQGDRDDLKKRLDALRTEYDAHKVNESAHHIPGEDLSDRVEDLEDLLEHFSRDGNDICIAGANLHVVNGTDTTDGTPNGLGNIIIGYNERRGTGGAGSDDKRTGSHFLIVGKELNYSGFGGIVVGRHNTASGEYCSVSGGCNNGAGGEYASVSGGCGRGAVNCEWAGGGLSSLYIRDDYHGDYWVRWYYRDEDGSWYEYIRLQDN